MNFYSIPGFQKLPGSWRRFLCKPWKREIRFLYHRLTRGWDDGDTFSLDYSLAQQIAPRLKRFSQLTIGIPSELEEREWKNIVDKMVAAFEFAGSDERWTAASDEFKKHQEGIELFAKHFFSLWW